MPTVAIIGPYRFYFYGCDAPEPRHIHVSRDRATAKFWLSPVRLGRSRKFGWAELFRIERLIVRHQDEFERKWDEYFNAD